MNQDQLHAYMDGELGPEAAAGVEAALASDPELAAQLRTLRAIDAALGVLPEASVSAEFTHRVLERVRRRRRQVLLRIGLPLAAAATLLLTLYRPREDPAPAPAVFTVSDHLTNYVWEADDETYGSLALDELEQSILDELEST